MNPKNSAIIFLAGVLTMNLHSQPKVLKLCPMAFLDRKPILHMPKI